MTAIIMHMQRVISEPSWQNRYKVMKLQENRSAIEWLVDVEQLLKKEM